MIKKIICPTDFSETANNAAEYAAKLAQVLGAELLFINVQQVMSVFAAVGMDEGIGANARGQARVTSEKLQIMCKDVNKLFKISTDYEVDVTTRSLVKILSASGTNNTMIVMGTNGIDDGYQFFFGTNTYNVIKKVNCPLLVVPENVSYGSIKKIVLAWDYNSESKFSFSLLSDFKKAFNPNFAFLHVSKHPTEISHDVFRALSEEVEAVLGSSNEISFEQVFSDDIPGAINEYMSESKADMLSLTFYNRGVIRNFFHGTVAKELSETADYPILVLHSL